MIMMSEHGERVDLEFLRQKLELEYVLVFWYNVHALLSPSEEKNILISPLLRVPILRPSHLNSHLIIIPRP